MTLVYTIKKEKESHIDHFRKEEKDQDHQIRPPLKLETRIAKQSSLNKKKTKNTRGENGTEKR